MNKSVTVHSISLKTISLGLAILLSTGLAPVAQADHDHERSANASQKRHDSYHQKESRHRQGHHHAERFHNKDHRAYRNDGHHHHVHKVIWQRPYDRPRLLIRLPWLVFVDY